MRRPQAEETVREAARPALREGSILREGLRAPRGAGDAQEARDLTVPRVEGRWTLSLQRLQRQGRISIIRTDLGDGPSPALAALSSRRALRPTDTVHSDRVESKPGQNWPK